MVSTGRAEEEKEECITSGDWRGKHKSLSREEGKRVLLKQSSKRCGPSLRRADPHEDARSFSRSLEEEEEEFIQPALVTKLILPATSS